MLPMAAADVLVTDYSSVAEEFLVFDRPLIFADHLATASGRDRAQRDKGDWDELFAFGLRLTESGEVGTALECSLAQPREYSTQRQKLRDFVFENLDGHCAARAADAIRALA
jgi:CDP-glycerol glycerophosphotransferase (TagB/SpsB family)